MSISVRPPGGMFSVSGVEDDIRLVCPKCRAQLETRSASLACPACAVSYLVDQAGFADFVDGAGVFDDWWVQSQDMMRKWLDREAPKEEQFVAGLARNYVLPLLAQLGCAPGRTRVLSVACGVGADVDVLNEAGYCTWGLDSGNRTLRWAERKYAHQLVRADARDMPFPDGSFDVVLAIDLLEHVGVIGDTTTVAPDYREQRLSAMRSLVHATRPGGHLLMSSLNKHFPIDFGHLQNSRFLRFHSPWESFLLSYGDVKRLCAATGEIDSTRTLPLRGFFSWTNLRHNGLARPFLPFADWLLGSLPDWVYGSPLSFFWVVLAHRRISEREMGK